jgi:putative endonuclease
MFITDDLKLSQGWIYFLMNRKRSVLYLGVTKDLIKRVDEHQAKKYPNNFSAKYNCVLLVYYENYGRIDKAIRREKQLKNWKREWKLELIKKKNSDLKNLYHGFINGDYLWE